MDQDGSLTLSQEPVENCSSDLNVVKFLDLTTNASKEIPQLVDCQRHYQEHSEVCCSGVTQKATSREDVLIGKNGPN